MVWSVDMDYVPNKKGPSPNPAIICLKACHKLSLKSLGSPSNHIINQTHSL